MEEQSDFYPLCNCRKRGSLLRGHISFICEKLNPGLKLFLSPTTVCFLQKEAVLVPDPRNDVYMYRQFCQPNLASLRFNIGIFIRSNSCLKCICRVYVKPLAASGKVVSCGLSPVILSTILIHFLGHPTEIQDPLLTGQFLTMVSSQASNFIPGISCTVFPLNKSVLVSKYTNENKQWLK